MEKAVTSDSYCSRKISTVMLSLQLVTARIKGTAIGSDSFRTGNIGNISDQEGQCTLVQHGCVCVCHV